MEIMSLSAQARAMPYIGPRPFTRLDVAQGWALYGRDWEVDQLVKLLVARRIVLFHAPSGAGKTSLIQARLIPRLEDEEFQVLPIVRVGLEPDAEAADGNRYAVSMLRSLGLNAKSAPTTGESALSMLDLACRLDDGPGGDGRPHVLVFDQFEEILTADPTDIEAKTAFFEQLGIALRNRNRWALFSMREDHLAALEPYVWALPTHLDTTFRLDFLGVDQAAEAIRRPAQDQAGVTFSDEAVDRLIDDLRRVRIQRADGRMDERLGPYVEPVQLQVVCRRLWEKLPPGTHEISEADLVVRQADHDG